MKKNDIENKREQFEKLKEVKDKIGHLHPTIIWFGDDGLYRTSFDFQDTVNWLNGAFLLMEKHIEALTILRGMKNRIRKIKAGSAQGKQCLEIIRRNE